MTTTQDSRAKAIMTMTAATSGDGQRRTDSQENKNGTVTGIARTGKP
jgi:hypothetical protein